MDPEMKLVLLFSLAAFGSFWAALLVLRCRLGFAAARLDGLRAARLDLEENHHKEDNHG